MAAGGTVGSMLLSIAAGCIVQPDLVDTGARPPNGEGGTQSPVATEPDIEETGETETVDTEVPEQVVWASDITLVGAYRLLNGELAAPHDMSFPYAALRIFGIESAEWSDPTIECELVWDLRYATWHTDFSNVSAYDGTPEHGYYVFDRNELVPTLSDCNHTLTIDDLGAYAALTFTLGFGPPSKWLIKTHTAPEEALTMTWSNASLPGADQHSPFFVSGYGVVHEIDAHGELVMDGQVAAYGTWDVDAEGLSDGLYLLQPFNGTLWAWRLNLLLGLQ